VVKVTAGGSISAIAEVEVGNPGKAVAKSSGVAVGYALTQGSNNNDAEISVY
jgi:ABC-type molybdate transport system substrate-binding protein